MVEISYKLLKLLEARPDISQRELARELGVSLGKTNYCVKVDNFRNSQNKLAYAYILTPKGVSEKAKVTLSFLQRKRNEFEAIKKEIEQLQLEIQQSGKSTE